MCCFSSNTSTLENKINMSKEKLIAIYKKLQSPYKYKCGLCMVNINKCKERIINLLTNKKTE
jgi:hypothetical protein